MENEGILTERDSTAAPKETVSSEESITEEETAFADVKTDDELDKAGEDVNEQIDYAALAAEDLATLKGEFPSLAEMTSLSELENPARYGALRELGLTAREAYLATTTPRVSSHLPYDNRSHLRSSVPRTHGAAGEQMSVNEMRAARELFSDLSDSEIVKLYKKVHT